MTAAGYTFCYYVSGHGFGHATRVNQIITELLQSKTTCLSTAVSNGPSIQQGDKEVKVAVATAGSRTEATAIATGAAAATTVPLATTTTITTTITKTESRHTIYIVSDAPQFIFQDVIALGAIYRNAKVDAGVVQPLAYSVDRKKTIEGVKAFLAKRDDMIRHEVSWLEQVGANCVLADAPFLPCAAASAYGIPACLITNFTFDEVYRFLREGDPMDKDVIAVADAALEDYKKASLLLRLPGSIDIPAFADEIMALESRGGIIKSMSIGGGDSCERHDERNGANGITHEPNGTHGQTIEHPRKHPHLSVNTSMFTAPSDVLRRRAIDVPLVVRKHINTREDVLRSLGVDEETIRTKKMVLVSFGGQRLKQGWGNPLPEGWIGVICGLPVSHELPAGFYRSPHGVYVPDLTHAADIVIGKLGYGTCSECIAHDTPLIYVSRPQFIEEHGLIKLMVNYGLPVEMTAEEFETGLWRRSILEADRLAQEEKERRRQYLDTHLEEEMDTLSIAMPISRSMSMSMEHLDKVRSDSAISGSSSSDSGGISRRRSLHTLNVLNYQRPSKAKSLAESVNMAEMARGGPISPFADDDDPPLLSPARSRRRSDSITSLSTATFRSRYANFGGISMGNMGYSGVAGTGAGTGVSGIDREMEEERPQCKERISHDGGKVCAQIVEEYMWIWDEHQREEGAAAAAAAQSVQAGAEAEAVAPV
ncbi:hypothetical protein B0O80DRAFT_467566 [Mortierella sp. GBAus27b]|nr:hypothetical protein B0O80DRAFT_467566 [Mortierella sp. GBAus27b]